MFTITPSQQQYLTYILADTDTPSRLEVVPARGGIITRWQLDSLDILYLDPSRFANPKMSVRGGIPILFPICGNLPNNRYTYQGQEYTLKQHGFARDMPWELSQQSTETCATITLVLNSNDQTRAVYPFDFQLAFTYQLQGNNLTIQQRYTNLSKEIMPFSTGIHPYFALRDKNNLALDIPAHQYMDQQSKGIYPFSGSFDFQSPEIDVAFTALKSNVTSLRDKQRGLEVVIKSDSSLFSTLVFWTVKGKDYVCLEPWSAPRNALNSGEQLTPLEPETSLETWIELTANFF